VGYSYVFLVLIVEYILHVDKKGRIVIPSDVRRALGIRRTIKLCLKGRRVILEPIEEPLEELSKLIIKVSIKASKEPGKLSRIASDQLAKECTKP